ncbi:hypothetical protein FRC20_009892, partial [Serendipita sp. 405]
MAEELQINIKGPNETKLQITISNDKTVLDLKRMIAEKADVEAERQRLIYSGKVLKDEDTLSTYKIQSSHTIHMVKGAPRTQASTSSALPPSLPTMATGQNPSDPLTMLNGPMGHGVMAGLNPFQDMGVNINDPNMMQSMMDSPEFYQRMSQIMSDPQILDQILNSHPQGAQMPPFVRDMMRSDQFRQMVANPETLRSMMQMTTAMRGGGAGAGGASPFGGLGGFGMPLAAGTPSGAGTTAAA